MKEHILSNEDKKQPIYRRLVAWVLGFVVYISSPPSPYDIIGAVPDIQDFWIPKFEELAKGCIEIENTINAIPDVQETFKEASKVFVRESQKLIEGSEEPKALPPSQPGLSASPKS